MKTKSGDESLNINPLESPTPVFNYNTKLVKQQLSNFTEINDAAQFELRANRISEKDEFSSESESM